MENFLLLCTNVRVRLKPKTTFKKNLNALKYQKSHFHGFFCFAVLRYKLNMQGIYTENKFFETRY